MVTSRPGRRPWRPATAASIALILCGIAPQATVAAPEPRTGPSAGPAEPASEAIVLTTGDDVLDRPILDAARLDPGQDGRQRVLVVLPGDGPGDPPTLETLAAGPDGWTVADHRDIRGMAPDPVDARRERSLDGDARLVRAPGRDAFVLILGRPDGERSRLIGLEVGSDGIRFGIERALDAGIDGAGVADVDGDARSELVLAVEESVPPATPGCGRLEVRDLETLALRLRTGLGRATPTGRLVGAALADVDGRPGAELLAVVGDCGPAPAWALRVVDPTTGVAIRDLDLGGTTDPLTGPVVVHVGDQASPPIVIVDDGDATVALDPADDWRRIPLGDGPARLVGTATGDGGTAVLLAGADGGRIERLDRLLLQRDPGDGRLIVGPVGRISRTDANLDRWSAVRPGPLTAQRWPVAASIDVDGDGCSDLVAPLVSLRCAGSGRADERLGPAWVATRPLFAYDGRGRRLMVASSLAWDPGGRGLDEPRPLAALEAAGSDWRSVPSGPFALAELPAPDLFYFSVFPVPQPTVDPTTGSEPLEATVAARAGERAFVRAVEVDPLESQASEPVRPTEGDVSALLGPVGEREAVIVARSPVDPGGLSGVDLEAIRVPLEVSVPGAGPARRWRVEVVSVSDWGEISSSFAAAVELDVVGPPIVVAPPLVSWPWPFEGSISGATDARAMVSVADRPAVEASRIGRFSVPVTLLPWPQTLELRAVDAEGNVSVRELEVVGGFDYRQIPPPVWLIGVVLIIVVVSVLRDPRGRDRLVAPTRPAGGASDPWSLEPGRRRPAPVDEPPLPTIEDLPGPRPVDHRLVPPEGRLKATPRRVS